MGLSVAKGHGVDWYLVALLAGQPFSAVENEGGNLKIVGAGGRVVAGLQNAGASHCCEFDSQVVAGGALGECMLNALTGFADTHV